MWWSRPARDSLHYPGFQQQRTSCCGAELDALHVVRTPIESRCTRLVPWPKDAIEPVLVRPSMQGWPRQDFTVMRRIVTWIARQQPKHLLHVSSYSSPSIIHSAHKPCPYCLALSIWFFHTAQSYYPTLARGYVESFTTTPVPLVLWESFEPCVLLGSDWFVPGRRFASWFRQRGLELLFLSILEFVFDWYARWASYLATGDFRAAFAGVSGATDFADRLCSASVADHGLTFYYAREHPLQAYRPPTLEFAGGFRCDGQDAYYRSMACTGLGGRFDEPIARSLSWHDFQRLHAALFRFLKTLPRP
jgi:hypothetical protein